MNTRIRLEGYHIWLESMVDGFPKFTKQGANALIMQPTTAKLLLSELQNSAGIGVVGCTEGGERIEPVAGPELTPNPFSRTHRLSAGEFKNALSFYSYSGQKLDSLS